MGLFRMPSLGSDMEAGTLVEWLVQPGDEVQRGDVVAVVETQKGAIEIDVFESGTVCELRAKIGQTLPVGAPLAVIGEEDETAPDVEPEPPALAPQTDVMPTRVVSDVQETPSSGHGRASPAARKAAEQAGINLADVQGTGPAGAVVLSDLPDMTAQKPAAKEKSRDTLTDMRRAVAAAMARAKREIPHFYLSQTIDLEPASAWLAARNADRPPAERLLIGALYVKAAALAAEAVPVLNGHFVDDAHHPSAKAHVGMAISLRGGGLVAPAIPDVGPRKIDEVMTALRDLTARARAGRLRSSEFTLGTLTVSSLGDAGPETMTGVIFPPQVALLAIGTPVTRPWIVDGEIAPRRVVTVTLSADHRVCDGRAASKFLVKLEQTLTCPEDL